MGSLKTLALAGAMAVSASALANAADYPYAPPPPPPPHEPLGLKGSIGSGWYLRGDVGVSAVTVGKYDQREARQANATFFGKEERSSAFFGGAGVGYRFNNWFRVDGTFEYRGGSTVGVSDSIDFTNSFGRPGRLTNTYKGNLTSMVALFNAYVDLGTWNCLTPYIGAGIGYASNTISGLTDQGINYPDPTGAFSSVIQPTLGTASKGDKSGVAWALMAGVGYEVNKNLTLEVGYRYLNLGDAQSGPIRNAFRNETYGPLKAKEIDSHDIKIGMRWNFGEPECCGPVERPVAYAPAPHVVRKY
ncbi:MAG: outer membrane beta-barrel protein [Beijerinckiaceae bacterium]|nr:outer membrane beta-barrel protein [Beijerinckiaceae bacterium]